MTPEKKQRRARTRLGPFTRFVVIPMLLVALGVQLGIVLARRAPEPGPVKAPPTGARDAAPSAASEPGEAGAPQIAASASFQDNLYPSLMISLGAAYPEYVRCLAFTLRNLPGSGALLLRVESPLFAAPAVIPVSAAGASLSLNPELPWNFDALRRNTQMRPQTFVATLLADGSSVAETSLLCTVHSVNEVVSRVLAGSPPQWQDTSVCFAAFVNEDHPWIGGLLSDAVAGGAARSFTGYQQGGQSATAQVQAIWESLAGKGLSYVNVSTDSGASPWVSTQYVRFLEQSVADKGANCVDASVLFASILRRIGLRPVLLFRPGHCFAGYYDSQEGGRIVAFEPTLLGSASFQTALAEGSKELQATLPYLGTPQYSIVDVAVCRQQGVSPIPYEPAEAN